jgi:hypothetical protein
MDEIKRIRAQKYQEHNAKKKRIVITTPGMLNYLFTANLHFFVNIGTILTKLDDECYVNKQGRIVKLPLSEFGKSFNEATIKLEDGSIYKLDTRTKLLPLQDAELYSD